MALRPGLVQGEAPPRLVKIDGKIVWDNPAAFGPVPALFKDGGEKVCAGLNTRWRRYHATGYHAHAQMLDGTPFWAGGFYCE